MLLPIAARRDSLRAIFFLINAVYALTTLMLAPAL
jgi:hypothetical protein